MKLYSPLLILGALVLFLSTTAFQCGSAELTTAKLAMQQKQWDKAEESLAKEVVKNDQNEEAWFLLGQVRLERKKYLEANEAYERALQLSSDHKAEITNNRLALWASMYNDGVNAYNEARYDDAIGKFKLAQVFQPDSVSTYHVMAVSYLALRDTTGAERTLTDALNRRPDYADAASLLGQVYFMRASSSRRQNDTTAVRNHYRKAALAFEVAYKAEPQNPDHIISLIEAYEQSDQTDRAMALTRDAVVSDPTNRAFRYAYGVFLLKQEKYPESIEQLTKSVELFDEVKVMYPDSVDNVYADAVYNCGVAYLNWGVALREKAEAAEEEARKKTRKEVKQDFTYKERFRSALPYFEKSVELRKNDATLWQQLGRLYANLNMLKESKKAYDEVDRLTKQ